MPTLDDGFAALLGRLPTDKERQRLLHIRDALGIRSNDALWQVLIALEYYQRQYERTPARLRKASKVILAGFKEQATKQAELVVLETERRVAEVAARAAEKVAVARARRGSTPQRFVAWCCAAVLLVTGLVGGASWWMYRAGYQSALQRGDSLTQWSATADGQLAYELAESGSLRSLARCEGPGWETHEGKCYPYPVGTKVYGWSLPRLGGRR